MPRDTFAMVRDGCAEEKRQGLPVQVEAALQVARDCGGFDGGHHKMWVIDQMVRALTGDRYAAWVADAKAGEDGPETYEWDEGIAP